jgi:sensor histidine kinase YesM
LCSAAALALLLAFVTAGNLNLRHLNRNACRIIAMLFVAPLCAFVLLVGTNEWSFETFMRSRSATYGWRILTLTAVTVGVTAALVAMLLENLRAAERKALQVELEKKTLESEALAAQMRLMQAQVEPHFLFNTLANVQQLIEDNSPTASTMLSSLIAYLKAAVPQMRTDLTTLGQELAMVGHYLSIMQMRMGSRLRWSLSLPADLAKCKIPPLIVITLVENAVQHGIDPMEQGGDVSVVARTQDDMIEISVSDNGKGTFGAVRDGFGLSNVRERLLTLWGARAALRITPNPSGGTVASILIPRAELSTTASAA